ncbi:MAG: GNAT family N-acetyltransferase [Alphaproteobacteria bacterium]
MTVRSGAGPSGLTWDRAMPPHAPVLAGLHEAAFPDGPVWSAADFGAFLAQPPALGVLGTVDGLPAGFALAVAAAPEADLVLIAVAPALRRSRIGSGLMAALDETLRAAGVREIFLDVADDNPDAIAFYKCLKFQEIGRRKQYYRRQARGSGESGGAKADRIDAILMARAWT